MQGSVTRIRDVLGRVSIDERGKRVFLAFRRLRVDFAAETAAGGVRSKLLLAVRVLITIRMQAVVLLRLGQALHAVSPVLGYPVKYVLHALTGADIALHADVGGGLRLFHPTGVVIGPNCVVGERCTIMQGVTLGAGQGGSPTVGDDVFLAPGSNVFGAFRIGSRCFVAANSVVLGALPDDSFAAGAPAKVIKGPASSRRPFD